MLKLDSLILGRLWSFLINEFIFRTALAKIMAKNAHLHKLWFEGMNSVLSYISVLNLYQIQIHSFLIQVLIIIYNIKDSSTAQIKKKIVQKFFTL